MCVKTDAELARENESTIPLIQAYRKAAQKRQKDGELEIDLGALVSVSPEGGGAYVAAWIWVPDTDVRP